MIPTLYASLPRFLRHVQYRNLTAYQGESLVNPPNDEGRTTTIAGINDRCGALFAIWHGTRWLASEAPDSTVKELLVEVERVFGQ